MDKIVTLPQRIVDWLSIQPELLDIRFFTEFPPVLKAVPLKEAIVAVGIEQLSIVDKFVANDEGVLEKQEYCRTATIRTRLSICVPYSYGGSACHDYFTKIIDALTFRTDFNIKESGCNEIESDRDTSALVCHGWFDCIADFCPADSVDENFTSFLNKEFVCGSHIRDTDIHVTTEEKDAWSNPVSMGMYMGTGKSSLSVPLGFKPRFVFVFASDFPLGVFNSEESIVAAKAGFASAYCCSAGIELTSAGFRVFNISSGINCSLMNELGYAYGYIAFK